MGPSFEGTFGGDEHVLSVLGLSSSALAPKQAVYIHFEMNLTFSDCRVPLQDLTPDEDNDERDRGT